MPTSLRVRVSSWGRGIRPLRRRNAFSTGARLLIVLMVVAACSRNKDIEEDQSDFRVDPIPIHVKNEGYLDVNVGVVASGVTRRLGTVTGNGSGDFKIAWSVANGQQVSVTATQIGGSQRFRSLGLSVRPGQMIEFRVGSVITQSSAVVREP